MNSKFRIFLHRFFIFMLGFNLASIMALYANHYNKLPDKSPNLIWFINPIVYIIGIYVTRSD